MTVNSDLSDLFFNTDHTNTIVRDRRKNDLFNTYDDTTLLQNAANFLGCIDRFTGGILNDLPTALELVDDFKTRI